MLLQQFLVIAPDVKVLKCRERVHDADRGLYRQSAPEHVAQMVETCAARDTIHHPLQDEVHHVIVAVERTKDELGANVVVAEMPVGSGPNVVLSDGDHVAFNVCRDSVSKFPADSDYAPADAAIVNGLVLAVLVFCVLITLATASRAVRYLLNSTVETLAGPPEYLAVTTPAHAVSQDFKTRCISCFPRYSGGPDGYCPRVQCRI